LIFKLIVSKRKRKKEKITGKQLEKLRKIKMRDIEGRNHDTDKRN
jgi:hypothetical protein